MSDEPEVKQITGEETAEKLRLIQAADLILKKHLGCAHFPGETLLLGKMIKCAKCGRRHRDEESCGTYNLIVEAEGQRARQIANPFWRSHPGAYTWIQDLKKFVTIHR